MFRGGRRGEAAGVKVREFKLNKSNGKLLKGFSQRNDSISFDKKKNSSSAVWEMDRGMSEGRDPVGGWSTDQAGDDGGLN